MNELNETFKDVIFGLRKMIKATLSLNGGLNSVSSEIKKSNKLYSSIGKFMTLGLKSDLKLINETRQLKKAIDEKKITETVKVKIENQINPKDFNKPVTLDESSKAFLSNSLIKSMGAMLLEFAKTIKATTPKITWPTNPKEPIAVRLSDGKKFYESIMQVFGGGGGFAAYKNESNESVRANTIDGRVQVDINTMPEVTIPPVTVDTTGLATDSNQTSGAQKTQIVDAGGEIATVTGGKLDVNATASLAGQAIPASGATEAVTVQIVDGSGNQVASFGGGTQYTEDAAAAGNPVGTALNLIRDDSRAGGLTTTDGDNVAARGNNKGELYVKTTDSDALLTTIDADTSNISTKIDTLAGTVTASKVQVDIATIPTVTVNSHAVTNAGTFPVQVDGAALTSLQLIDDAVYSGDAANAKYLGVGAQFDDVSPATVTENNVRALRMSSRRELYTQIRDAAGNERGANVTAAGALQVDGSAVTQPVSVASIPSHAVTNAGVFATQIDGAALTALQLIDDTVATLGTTTYTEAATKGNVIGAVRRDANTSLVDTTNEVAPLQVNATGELKVAQIQPLPAGTAVIGKVSIDQTTPGTTNLVDTELPAAAALGATDANPTAPAVGAFNMLFANTAGTWNRMRSMENGINSTGSGIMNAGVIAQFDDVSPGAITENQFGPLRMSSRREGYIQIRDAAGNERGLNVDANGEIGVSAIRSALPAGTNAIGKLAANSGVTIGAVEIAAAQTLATVTSLTQMNGQAIAMGTGSRSAGTQRVTIATDDVVPASQSGTWTVQPGNTPNSTPWLVTDTPSTTGGLSKFHLVGAASDNATNVKASAGQVYAITAFNLNASPRYLKFHNTAGTPTAGAGVTETFMIPGNTSGTGLVINIDKGISFGTGIAITIVTGIADNNTAAISASEVVVNIYYK